jgi:hypothetical protein
MPILQGLMDKPQELYALVLSPTRELAIQIAEQFEALGSGIGLKTAVLVGGIDMMAQVGTPAAPWCCQGFVLPRGSTGSREARDCRVAVRGMRVGTAALKQWEWPLTAGRSWARQSPVRHLHHCCCAAAKSQLPPSK